MTGTKLNRNNLVEQLLLFFPDFGREITDDETGLPYVVLGNFADYILKGLKSEKFNSSRLDSIGSFLTKMAESEDLEVQNIIVVSVFEPISDSDEGVEFCKVKLNKKALHLFKKTIEGWGS